MTHPALSVHTKAENTREHKQSKATHMVERSCDKETDQNEENIFLSVVIFVPFVTGKLSCL